MCICTVLYYGQACDNIASGFVTHGQACDNIASGFVTHGQACDNIASGFVTHGEPIVSEKKDAHNDT